jgi:threonine dehydrogenase-like Zn-dependent dehydrogenase
VARPRSLVQDVEDARIEAPTDVLLRVTSAALCGTDLHICEGRLGDVTGMVTGHEPLGVVEEVGSAVATVKGAIGSPCRRTSAVASASTVSAATPTPA